MRVLLLLTLYNVFNVILAQFDIVNKDLGDVHLQAAVGNVPWKYIPLSEQDQKTSDKVSHTAAMFIDYFQINDKMNPMKIPVITNKPLRIDVPFLFFRGKVYLHSLVLDAMKQLALNDLELRLNNLQADVNITIPKVHFEVQAHLNAYIGFMPIMFNCHLSVNLFDVGIAVTSGGVRTQAPRVGEVLQIQSAAVKVDIRDVVFNLTMDMGEKPPNDYEEDYEEYEDEDSPVTQWFINILCSSSASHGNILNYLLQTAVDMNNKGLFQTPIHELFTF